MTTKTLGAIRELIRIIEIESKDEPDDFNYGLCKSLSTFAGETLYQLTRGGEGIRNDLQLEVVAL